MKRYFYYKENNLKIKRQVIWHTSDENWCFLDYRYNFKGKIDIGNIGCPPEFDFGRLLMLATDSLASLPKEIPEKKRKLRTESVEESSLIPYPEFPHFYNDLSDAFEPNMASLDLETLNELVDPLQGDLYLEDSKLGFDSDFETVLKKHKKEIEELPSSQALESPTSISPSGSSFSFSFSPFDYLFNHLLSYDQILDTICQNICTQLIFNRKCFQRTGLDSNTLLQRLMQRCSLIEIDMSEFPGKLLRNFFGWLFECFNGIPAIRLPPIYCLVCGKGDGDHDPVAHERFSHEPLAVRFREKASNFYDVVKELISFLLRNPGSRQPFRLFISENVHCPFCAEKNGKHCHEKHQEWKNIYSIDPPCSSTEPAPEPTPSDNLDHYTQSAFDYLMERMPFHIPSFLLSMNNIQTFLDCLVTLWKSIRLV